MTLLDEDGNKLRDAVIYKNLKYLVLSLCNYHRQGSKPNIYLFSTPRSGSTWLMELIASQPGFKFYDEPLNIRRDNVQKADCIKSWEDTMPGTAKEDLICRYLSKLETNKIRVMNPPPFRRNHRLLTNRVILKIHEIEHMINLIKAHSRAKIIYLLRHPIATTVSRHVFPRLEYYVNSNHFSSQYLTSEQLELGRDIFHSGSDFEKGILSWCYQNLIPLKFLDQRDWIIITYEELLLNSYKACEMLFEKLDLEDLNIMKKRIGIPATNINISTRETIEIMKDSSGKNRKRKIVTKWKNKLTESQEQQAFDILSVFSIDAYLLGRFVANEKYLNFNDTATLI